MRRGRHWGGLLLSVALPVLAPSCGAAGALTVAPQPVALTVPLTAASTGWAPPMAARLVVTRGFDAPQSPYGPGHRGVDLAGHAGTAVLAAGPGIVTLAGTVAGIPVVVVAHAGGLRTTYQPVRAAVRPGAVVGGGDRLGTLAAGHPGCPTAACLHWGLIRRTLAGDAYLDPLLLLGLGPPRLLPLTG